MGRSLTHLVIEASHSNLKLAKEKLSEVINVSTNVKLEGEGRHVGIGK